jgi:hypothetical protein
VNEPRVDTPDEVQREIVAQVRDGYDLIKYHEVMNAAGTRFRHHYWTFAVAYTNRLT